MKKILFLIFIFSLNNYASEIITNKEEKIYSQFNLKDGSHINFTYYIKSKMENSERYENIETVFCDLGDKIYVETEFRFKYGFGAGIQKKKYAYIDYQGNIIKILNSFEVPENQKKIELFDIYKYEKKFFKNRDSKKSEKSEINFMTYLLIIALFSVPLFVGIVLISDKKRMGVTYASQERNGKAVGKIVSAVFFIMFFIVVIISSLLNK
jgi:hypothetical protein